MQNIEVNVTGGDMPVEERNAYLNRALSIYGKDHTLKKIDIIIDKNDPDMVDIKYTFLSRPFDRIRRITGYLVGSLDRWNSAKQAEEHDRVKHAERPKDRCGECSNYNSDSTPGIGWCSASDMSVLQSNEACAGFKK